MDLIIQSEVVVGGGNAAAAAAALAAIMGVVDSIIQAMEMCHIMRLHLNIVNSILDEDV
jgi:uncharacterized protein involved in propanediol utilization